MGNPKLPTRLAIACKSMFCLLLRKEGRRTASPRLPEKSGKLFSYYLVLFLACRVGSSSAGSSSSPFFAAAATVQVMV